MASFAIGAINTDKTNRHVDISNVSTLGDDLSHQFTRMKLDVVTFSEVSSIKSIHRFAQGCGDKDIDFVKTDKKQDHIVLAWDVEKFKINGSYDVSSNYIGVPLLFHETECNQLHVSVHNPHKNGKVTVQNNLKRYVDEKLKTGKFQEIYIHGDFNMTPTEVVKLFNDPFIVAFNEGTSTLTTGNSKDNVVFSDKCDFVTEVFEQGHKYTHHPIKVEIKDIE